MEEKLLTRFPIEGLFQKYRSQFTRDRQAEAFEGFGFEVQSWQVNGVYGFSYSKNRKLSKKQLDEFNKLSK